MHLYMQMNVHTYRIARNFGKHLSQYDFKKYFRKSPKQCMITSMSILVTIIKIKLINKIIINKLNNNLIINKLN